MTCKTCNETLDEYNQEYSCDNCDNTACDNCKINLGEIVICEKCQKELDNELEKWLN